MATSHNQQEGIAALAKVNPDYANALSGQNPPFQPPYEKPDLTNSFLFRFLIPWTLPFIWLFFAMQAQPNEFPVYSPLLIFVIIGDCISVYIGRKMKRTQEQLHPLPAAPILYTLHPVLTEFLKQYLGNEVIITLRYDIPIDAQQSSIAPLHKLLSIETEEVLDRFIEDCESAYRGAPEDEQAFLRENLFLKPYSDLIEYQLVPRFGRAVYESKIPVFRFKITAKSPRSVIEHDIEVGDIIEGKF
jgi:hypothetical protein